MKNLIKSEAIESLQRINKAEKEINYEDLVKEINQLVFSFCPGEISINEATVISSVIFDLITEPEKYLHENNF